MSTPQPPPMPPPGAGVDMDDIAARLQEHGTVMFGRDAGCNYTKYMKQLVAPYLGKEILYVPCDGGDAEFKLCEKVGVRLTPSMAFGGSVFSGLMDGQKLSDALAIPERIARRLAERSTTLYGRDDCPWTARQRQALGRHMSRVEYVSCDATPRRCTAAGVTAVPAWSVEGSRPIAGYRPLAGLADMAQASGPELESLAREAAAAVEFSSAAGAGGAGAAGQ